MSCQTDFNTDAPGVASCNRNNCRCGDDTNCMYYNSSGPGKSHYNYFAVQGTGEPGEEDYRCMNKAFDYYNEENMYDDHALGGMGTYAETTGYADKAGSVCYDDKKCSEYQYGQRDMCDECDMDKPDFHRGSRHPVLGQPLLPPSLGAALRDGPGGSSFLGIDKQYWLLAAAAGAFLAWKKGKLNLTGGNRQTLLLLMIAAVLAVLFFFR